MEFNISASKVLRFLWMVILLQAAVYAITGVISWYRFGLSIYQFSIGLSWAGLIVLIISGIFFLSAKPKSNRPSLMSTIMGSKKTDKEKVPLDQASSYTSNIFSSIKPMMGRGLLFGKAEESDDLETVKKEPTEADKADEKDNRKKLYYNSAMFLVLGALTIASSEFLYRLVAESAK